MDGGQGARFPTTRWSVVAEAGREGREALTDLCQAYWYPVYAFIRRHGRSAEDARDLTQEFFATLLASHGIAAATPERGRFRSFLLASVRNFLLNDVDKTNALKRGGGRVQLSLTMENAEDRYIAEPGDGVSPERLFERAWGTQLLTHAMDSLRVEYDQSGRHDRFDVMKPFLGPGSRGDLSAVAQALGVSDGAVRIAIHRFRARYGELLRREIAATLDEPGDAESEIRYLLSVFGDEGGAPARAY